LLLLLLLLEVAVGEQRSVAGGVWACWDLAVGSDEETRRINQNHVSNLSLPSIPNQNFLIKPRSSPNLITNFLSHFKIPLILDSPNALENSNSRTWKQSQYMTDIIGNDTLNFYFEFLSIDNINLHAKHG
jgi:hypothetical protein